MLVLVFNNVIQYHKFSFYKNTFLFFQCVVNHRYIVCILFQLYRDFDSIYSITKKILTPALCVDLVKFVTICTTPVPNFSSPDGSGDTVRQTGRDLRCDMIVGA